MQNKIKIIISFLFTILFLIASAIYLYNKNSHKEILSGQEVEQEVSLPVPIERERELILKGDESSKDLIEKYAVSTQTLIINENCRMNPLVMRFKKGDRLSIINQDEKEHIIAFENGNFLSVYPGDTREININETFGFDEGIFRYSCSDTSNDNVGVMYINQ